MAEEISRFEAEKRLIGNFVGSNFDGIKYFVTGWQLRFIGNDDHCLIEAAHIVVPENNRLNRHAKGNPIISMETCEPNESSVASVLFSVINRCSIKDLTIELNNDVKITFENGAQCQVVGTDEIVDLVWQFYFLDEVITNDGDGFYVAKLRQSDIRKF